MEFMRLKTPVTSVVLGEAGGGGALALGVCDRLAMLENALYSVISPRGRSVEGRFKEQEACEVLKMTAEDMVEFGIAEAIIDEPNGSAHYDVYKIAENIKEFFGRNAERKFFKKY